MIDCCLGMRLALNIRCFSKNFFFIIVTNIIIIIIIVIIIFIIIIIIVIVIIRDSLPFVCKINVLTKAYQKLSKPVVI